MVRCVVCIRGDLVGIPATSPTAAHASTHAGDFMYCLTQCARGLVGCAALLVSRTTGRASVRTQVARIACMLDVPRTLERPLASAPSERPLLLGLGTGAPWKRCERRYHCLSCTTSGLAEGSALSATPPDTRRLFCSPLRNPESRRTTIRRICDCPDCSRTTQ